MLCGTNSKTLHSSPTALYPYPATTVGVRLIFPGRLNPLLLLKNTPTTYLKEMIHVIGLQLRGRKDVIVHAPEVLHRRKRRHLLLLRSPLLLLSTPSLASRSPTPLPLCGSHTKDTTHCSADSTPHVPPLSANLFGGHRRQLSVFCFQCEKGGKPRFSPNNPILTQSSPKHLKTLLNNKHRKMNCS